MKYLSLLIAAFALSLGACERHSWEDQKDENGIVTEKGTKRLFPAHGEHGGQEGDHGADKAEHKTGEKPEGGGGAGH